MNIVTDNCNPVLGNSMGNWISSNTSLNQSVKPGSTESVMSKDALEIPADFKEAWLGLNPSLQWNLWELRDALVWALGELLAERFAKHHEVNDCTMKNGSPVVCKECGDQSYWDERHTWTEADWQGAARRELCAIR
jgi:hypothetical protein